MFTTDSNEAALDKAIGKLLLELQDNDTTSDEYAKTVEQLSKLYKLKETTSKKHVSPDTWALVGANIAGIVLVLYFERLNVVTSKAFGFIGRLR